MIVGHSQERYSRQVSLAEFGEKGQQKLFGASVLVVGAGGLGCPVLQYLAAAGVGTLGVADYDTVSLSNLHRQLLYATGDVGMPKANLAAERLKALNPELNVRVHATQVTALNACELFKYYDIIVDGTDNFTTRYLINDACVLLNKPLVFAGIYKFEGHLAVFNVKNEAGKSCNYRHLFAHPPAPGEAPGCGETGVMNVLPGIIGTMQAAEVIKLITGVGTPLAAQLLTYNVLTHRSYTIGIEPYPLPEGIIPADEESFRNTDYKWLCGESNTLSPQEFELFIKDENTLVVDVREKGEIPEADFPHVKIPLSALKDRLRDLPLLSNRRIIFLCQSGTRSLQAAEIARQKLPGKQDIFSLKGGITGFKTSQNA